jgi:hypothetical protein
MSVDLILFALNLIVLQIIVKSVVRMCLAVAPVFQAAVLSTQSSAQRRSTIRSWPLALPPLLHMVVQPKALRVAVLERSSSAAQVALFLTRILSPVVRHSEKEGWYDPRSVVKL